MPGWLEDSWYTKYSWSRTYTTCKAVVQRGRTVRSITIGCCPRRLRSARRLAVWKPLDLAQTERRPADRRISINLVWYGNVGPLRDGWPVHPLVFCFLPAAITDAAADAPHFMLRRTWFISSPCEPPHSTCPISLRLQSFQPTSKIYQRLSNSQITLIKYFTCITNRASFWIIR